jgi:glycosyltransferase involved in cell wall biosynthesis
MKLSIIIPCFNEEDILSSTFNRFSCILSEDCKKQHYEYTIIFVNDGSRDNTIDLIKGFAQNDICVKYISFTRNFGKEAAILAGLSYADGDAVVMMDADLQHPPELICEMVQYYVDGYDQVIAKRSRKGDAKVKSFFSSIYYKLVNKIVDVELTDGVGDFRLLSRRAVNAVLSLTEYNRFSKGLFSWIGFDAKIFEYENQPRVSGKSKWSFRSLVHYGIDGILSFNNKPLRLTIYMGFVLVLISIIYIVWTFISILKNGIQLPGYFTSITSTLVLGGVQLISIGIIGEYIGRIYYEVKRRPHYLVKETNSKIGSIKDVTIPGEINEK